MHALAQRKAFLLRVDPALLEAVQRWADDDLRSLNGQIEFLLRKALADAGRARPTDGRPGGAPAAGPAPQAGAADAAPGDHPSDA